MGDKGWFCYNCYVNVGPNWKFHCPNCGAKRPAK